MRKFELVVAQEMELGVVQHFHNYSNFLYVLEIFSGFEEIWETFCTKFVNYLADILRMKSFQKDFGKTVVKLPVKSKRAPTLKQ